MEHPLNYEGCNFFRQRIILSILSGRPLKITQIRSTDQKPGISDYEVKFIKLIDQLTNGSRFEINRTGSEIRFWPGMIQGGTIELNCGTERCISYFLEPIMILAPFTKLAIEARLSGITNCPDEPSVDVLRAIWLPIFSKFIFDDELLEIKVPSRGFAPDGGGIATFSSPICRQLQPVQWEKAGKVCKIRGLAFISKVSPVLASRMIDSAKKTLRGFLTDVFITVDQRKGVSGGKCPGYGLFLTAETTEGVIYHGEFISKPKGTIGELLTPEEVGEKAVENLLCEIYRGGCIDSTAQSMTAIFMSLCQKDVSKFLFGPLSDYWSLIQIHDFLIYSHFYFSVFTLRHLRDFFDVKFKIDRWIIERKEDEDELRLGSRDKALLTCVGAGFTNLNKVLL